LAADFSLYLPENESRRLAYMAAEGDVGPSVCAEIEGLSPAQLAVIVSSLALGVVLLDQDARVCYTNAAAARLLGAPSPAVLTGTPILQWLPAIKEELARAYAQTSLRAPVRVSAIPGSGCMLCIEMLPAITPSSEAQVVLALRDAALAATPAEISEWQLMRYAEDLTTIYAEERQARERLEEAHRALKQAAAEREALYRELQDREVRLRSFTEQLIDSQEAAHRRVAADLHDGLAQMIVSIHQHLQACLRLVPDGPASRYLSQASALAREASQEIRRLIADLRPPMLDDFGLVPALQRQLATAAESAGWAAECVIEGTQQVLPPSVETAVFRIFQEILTNVRKHAHATAVNATITFSENALSLSVADNGKGFDAAILANRMPINSQQMGLWGIRERVNLLNGSLELISVPGRGTRVTVRFPIPPGH
jgi:signal transduction histidine kinase